MTKQINIKKNNGKSEVFNLDKIHKVLKWAIDNLTGVSISDIEMKSSFDMIDGISTNDIHESLINAARDLISEESPNYQYVAARLALFKLRKEVFGQYEPVSLWDQLHKGVNVKKYTDDLIKKYTHDEINQIEEMIDHNRDYNLTFVAINEFKNKYLVQNRKTKQLFESPQFCYIIQAMASYMNCDPSERMTLIKNDYDMVSEFYVSLPTPIMGGLRSTIKQYSSCVLIECDDTVDSIAATGSAINKYVSKKAGIGVNLGRLRAEGAEIRDGDAYHTGITPIARKMQADVKSFSQGGIRGGAATAFFPFWHLEIEQILSLKNEKGTDDNRVRRLDYGIQFNEFLYRRLLTGKNISLFSPEEVPDLYEAFFADQDEFARLYEYYESNADNLVQYDSIPAAELFNHYQTERAETGRYYWQNVDHTNTYGKFISNKAPIKQSNLCVAPETKILTKSGYVPISELEGEYIEIWNGQEWSFVTITKTGENQKLLTVETNSGYSLDCTKYHKFYIFDGYGKDYKEVRTHELKNGDKLAKFDLPVIEGTKELDKAYINGFYSADGCLTRQGQRIYLYDKKRKLSEHFYDGSKWSYLESMNRQHKHYKDLKDKYFVPSEEYTISSRLDWLSGYLDGDGCLQKNGTNESIVAVSVEKEFLKEIQMMLQTLGVSSKIITAMEEGERVMPKNDGSGDNKSYNCKESFRILISSNDLYKLQSLGLKFNRLETSFNLPQRDAKHFIKIESVIDHGRIDDTYCFTEPKRNMGMFNGLLTGNCLEIALPTKPLQYDRDEDGLIALCTLAAINMGKIKDLEDLEDICYMVVRKLDELLDYQEYPVIAAEKHTKLFRPIGVGVINYAYWLAKNNLTYNHESDKYQESLDKTHNFFEAFQYFLIKASIKLAKEKGKCDGYDMTKWSQGILPIDNYKSNVDELSDTPYLQDWESLREDLKKYGIRNATLSALMPAETSAKISNSTNGIEPVRDLVSLKGGKESLTAQVVPEIRKLKNKYDLLYSLPSPKGYVGLAAVMQKFICQAISSNFSYNPEQEQYKNSGGKIPSSLMLQDQLYAFKYGLKTGYYHNTFDGNDDILDEIQDDEDDCDGCKI